ncbi:protein-disulfide isomerase [Haloactinopolyspora alba]|uniref:Protein-disulfide isomerase n=1 Tax=Haloactinopolyspora alba TaxID=648780 RepID=A0A2P8E3X6_9ACTN|nr:thioredoxin domain-containing protein [Haloactinopolyspora alba]PSL04178.1 protein-disulfide isomerase [Haloactinopolyspora alba]
MTSKKAQARQRAEAEREQEARQERRRERMLRVGVSAGVLLVVVIVAVVVLGRGGSSEPEGTGAIPEGATSSGDGVAVGDVSAPVTIDYWFDFQCPYCGEFEAENGPVLRELVADGTARVVYHPAAFLGEESYRASSAFACAVEAGRPVEYKTELFAHQPEEGSGGYTREELLTRAEAVGIADASFEACLTEGTYADWGATVLDAMRDQEIEATPAVLIDGEALDDPAGMSADEFRAAVDEAVTAS